MNDEGKATDLVLSGTLSSSGTQLVVTTFGATTSDILYCVNNSCKLWVDEAGGTEEDFLRRTLTAEATDEASILGGQGLEKLEDLLGIPVKVTAYQGMRNVDPAYWENSKLGVYVVVDLTDSDGQVHTVALGSADAIVKTVKLFEAGHIPQAGWTLFKKSDKATASGFYPINMVAAKDPTAF